MGEYSILSRAFSAKLGSHQLSFRKNISRYPQSILIDQDHPIQRYNYLMTGVDLSNVAPTDLLCYKFLSLLGRIWRDCNEYLYWH